MTGRIPGPWLRMIRWIRLLRWNAGLRLRMIRRVRLLRWDPWFWRRRFRRNSRLLRTLRRHCRLLFARSICMSISVAIRAHQLLRQSEDYSREQVIGNRLVEIAKYFRDCGQTFEPQTVIHLKTETKIFNVTKRFSWFHWGLL